MLLNKYRKYSLEELSMIAKEFASMPQTRYVKKELEKIRKEKLRRQMQLHRIWENL